jgi:sugar lactone lactonase YvrE
VEDGRLLRIDPDGGRVEVVANTGGRPLGIELLGDGRLLVCDARRGLLTVDPEGGAVEVLVDRVAGEPLRFCNNAAVAADQTVYFSDSSRRFGIDHWRGDILEHSGTGRLLRRDPGGAVEVLLEGLQFANGVALGPGESSVTVAESGAYRLTRLWLAGERAGQRDVLVDNLPGFPDNLAAGSSPRATRCWIACTGCLPSCGGPCGRCRSGSSPSRPGRCGCSPSTPPDRWPMTFRALATATPS